MAVFVIIPLCWDMFRILYDPVNKMGFCNGPSCVNPIRAWFTKNISHSLSFLVRLKRRFLVPA
jgi:hypothetical protein